MKLRDWHIEAILYFIAILSSLGIILACFKQMDRQDKALFEYIKTER